MDELLQSLSPPEQKAVALLKTSLDCYNSYDGTGLFTGPDRYAVLQGRVELAATQAHTLFKFWSVLLHKMLWPTPPKGMDETLLALLTDPQETVVLQVLATQASSCLTLARYLHDKDKAARKGQT